MGHARGTPRRLRSARWSSPGTWAGVAFAATLLSSLGDPEVALAQSTAVEVAGGAIAHPQTPAQLAAASVVDVAFAGGIAGRRFEYSNGIQPHGSLYTLFPAPAAGARGQLFPLAHAGAPWGDVGLIADYERIFSQMNDADSVGTDVRPSSYAAGLRARIHPGPDPRLIVGVSVEYAFTSFRPVGPPPFNLPDVTYRSVRSAIDTRVYAGRFSLIEEVGFRFVVDGDAISTRFYSPEGHGLDAELGAALLLVRGVEARAVVDYELHSFTFTPPAGATFGAGSARDQLYGARLALAFVL